MGNYCTTHILIKTTIQFTELFCMELFTLSMGEATTTNHFQYWYFLTWQINAIESSSTYTTLLTQFLLGRITTDDLIWKWNTTRCRCCVEAFLKLCWTLNCVKLSWNRNRTMLFWQKFSNRPQLWNSFTMHKINVY